MALTTEQYLQAAEPSLKHLHAHFGDNPPVVSDVVDSEGNQYVNLVQEGGGVLGVALVGYVYVLEKMGIRFMKMAGTSAGAINTLLLACVGDKNEAKSLKLLEKLNSKNLFDFVDGDKTNRAIIKRIVTSKGFFKRIIILTATTLVSFIIGVLMLAYQLGHSRYSFWFWLAVGLVAASSAVIGRSIWWIARRRKAFFNASYGINPGNNFFEWVKGILEEHGINNLSDLKAHLEKVPPGGFQLRRQADPEALADLNKPKMENFLVLIASDVTNQMKVEFPRLWNLYWENQNDVHPASFVRASMAVPVFFQPFIVNNIPKTQVFEAWHDFAGIEDAEQIPGEARFVDGGMISNFPINVFYNPNVAVPRLPTFGILLDDEDISAKPSSEYRSFLSFAAAMFNTVRYNYDKEFLIKNADFNKTIGRIDVRGINWLNFNLTDAEKLELFRRGADAAARFLIGPAPAPVAQAEQEVAQVSERGISAAPPAAAARGGFSWESYKAYRKERKKARGF